MRRTVATPKNGYLTMRAACFRSVRSWDTHLFPATLTVPWAPFRPEIRPRINISLLAYCHERGPVESRAVRDRWHPVEACRHASRATRDDSENRISEPVSKSLFLRTARAGHDGAKPKKQAGRAQRSIQRLTEDLYSDWNEAASTSSTAARGLLRYHAALHDEIRSCHHAREGAMDQGSFDALTQRVAATGSRRGLLGVLLGMAVVAGDGTASARGKRHRRRKRKDHPATVLVCHNGDTLSVPPQAVSGIVQAGGSSGPCASAGSVAPAAPGAGETCNPLPAAALCSTTDECCPSVTGRICAQNGCAIPDRPRCCAGVGQFCNGSCECCGFDLDCVNRKCVYAPR
jgi:hypothetical protein